MAQAIEHPEQLSVASGLTDVFPTVWTFEAVGEVEVQVDAGTGFVRKEQGVHYDVGDGDWLNDGADCVFRDGHRPVAGDRVLRRRVTPIRQSEPFGDTSTFLPQASEAAYDRLTRIDQEQAALLDRALIVPPGETPPTPEDIRKAGEAGAAAAAAQAAAEAAAAEAAEAAQAVDGKIDIELPATSPSVDDSPYRAVPILDKPHIPERFVRASESLSAILAGTADATDVIQRMLDATQQDEKDKMKPLELGAGVFRLAGRAHIDLGTYKGSALTIRGAGNNATKLLADPGNRDGLIRINRPHNMEHVSIRDLALCSILAQDDWVYPDDDYDPAANNGVGLHITTDIQPGHHAFGVQQDVAVRLENIHVHGFGQHSGLAHNVGVWGEAAIRVDSAWFPQFYNIQARGLYDRGFESCRFENNQHALLMNHCYAPEILNPVIEGYWDRAIANVGCEVGDDLSQRFTLRWEGGRVIGGILAGCNDAIWLSHDYVGGSVMSPTFHVIGTHMNARRFNFRSNGHRQIVFAGVQFHAQTQVAPGVGHANPTPIVPPMSLDPANPTHFDPATCEPLPASVYVIDGGDVEVAGGSQFLEPGRYWSDADAYVGLRIREVESTLSPGYSANGGYRFAPSRLNFNGIAVHVAASQFSRSIQVTLPQRGGSLVGGRYFREVVDLSGKSPVLWLEALQELHDEFRVVSRTADINASPVMTLARHRSDYASPADGALTYYGIAGLNTAGVEKLAMMLEARWLNSTPGNEASGVSLFAINAGVPVNILSYANGLLNQIVNQATRTSISANANPRPKDNNYRERSDFATVANGKLGSYAFQGLNSAGVPTEVAGWEASFVSNIAGVETSRLVCYGRQSGAIVQPIVIEGDRVIIDKLCTGSVVPHGDVPITGHVVLRDTFGNTYRVGTVA